METTPETTQTPNPPARKVRTRIPMSVPQRKLEVAEREGYHRHWFKESNVARAIQGGYDFVNSGDAEVNQNGVGTDRSIDGNADMGSHIRVVAGEGERHETEYLVLMEIQLEWYQEDQRLIEKRNADILSGIFRDERIMAEDKHLPQDRNLNYVDRDKTKAVFNRPTRKGK